MIATTKASLVLSSCFDKWVLSMHSGGETEQALKNHHVCPANQD
jgi:hypothetical protein